MKLAGLRGFWRAGEGASLGRRMGSAAAWSSMGSIAMRLGTFAVGIVAARLIAPDEFGVFAVAITVHAIIINASDLGVSAYIVRHDGDLDSIGPTVTTIAFASAACLTGAMALAAPWVSAQLGSGEATDPVRLLSLTVLLAGISSVPGAQLTREFRQDKLFLASAANFLVSTGVLLVLAFGGAGALALASSRVAGQAVSTLVLFKSAPKRFWPGFDRTVTSSVISFGLPLVGSSFLGFLIGNVDFIVVGRLLGAEPLGLYYLAYNVGSWPMMILGPIVASLAVAAFSRVRADRERIASRIGTAMSALVLVALPASALIASLASPLVNLVYGSRWAPAAAALALTAIYGALRIPADLFYNVTIAEGHTRKLFALQVVYLAALAPLTIGAVEAWGIAGAGAAHIAANVAVLLPGFMLILAGPTGFGPRRFLAAVARPALAALATGLVAHWVAGQFEQAWLALLLGGLAGLAVYALLIVSWARDVLGSARRLWADPEADERARKEGEQAAERAPVVVPAPEGVHA
jgi:lipopolysaccharide exporter